MNTISNNTCLEYSIKDGYIIPIKLNLNKLFTFIFIYDNINI